MQSLRLKKRLKTAKRGHKLLKDKQDELMRNFLELIETIKGLRKRTEDMLIDAVRRYSMATSGLSDFELSSLITAPSYMPTLSVSKKILMNLTLPVMRLSFVAGPSYSALSSPPDTDFALEKAREAIVLLVQLAETEKRMELLADELDKTRRRVNALEYILIPDLAETIKFIKMKLEEAERGNLTRLMKVKDIIEARKNA
jgi:V/A-type H+-transporting ATPase subunit D